MGGSFSNLGDTVIRVVSNTRARIGAAAFRGSVIAFEGGGSIVALLVRLKCLTCSRGQRVTCVPGRRVHVRFVGTIRSSG